MRVGESFAVNYMSRNNDALWLWLDVKLGRFWYVFMWHKGQRPYLYRSTDATPPDREYGKNDGRWFFGRSVGRLDRPVGRPLPERENSAEWFAARCEEVRKEIATWPRWMREGLGIASARLPQMPRECFACGGRLGCRADCDGLPMYASLSEPTAPKRPT